MGDKEALTQFGRLLTTLTTYKSFQDDWDTKQEIMRRAKPEATKMDILLATLIQMDNKWNMTKNNLNTHHSSTTTRKGKTYESITHSVHQGYDEDERNHQRNSVTERLYAYNEQSIPEKEGSIHNLFGHEDTNKCGFCLQDMGTSTKHTVTHSGVRGKICKYAWRDLRSGRTGINVDLLISEMVNKINGTKEFIEYIRDMKQVGVLRTYSQADIEMFDAHVEERVARYIGAGYKFTNFGEQQRPANTFGNNTTANRGNTNRGDARRYTNSNQNQTHQEQQRENIVPKPTVTISTRTIPQPQTESREVTKSE